MSAVPEVSVVIPCHNQGEFVGEALRSVYAQTISDWEVVIVNDGSTDDSAAVLDAIDHPKVRVLHQTNRGLPETRNVAIRAARAQFLLPLDADDRIEPRMLERCLAAIRADSTLGFVYTNYRTFGAEEREVRHAPYNFYRLLFENTVTVCALIRRRAWQEAGGYDPAMVHGAEDWDFWLSCGERNWHGRRLRHSLFRYRIRPGSMWASTRAKLETIRGQIRAKHPGLYEPEGMDRIKRRWLRLHDIHNPDSIYARALRILPKPARDALGRAYERWVR